jgi:predicted RNA binding protein YcfA (HicA-like mRNA interferase family)
MPRLHKVSGQEAVEGTVGCVVPLHRELAIGTLRSVLRQAGVTPGEFMENLD